MACSRILVVGSPGTGKSRLAAELGARLDLPVVHLDHPTRTALRGVVARRWGRGQNRSDVPEGWRERVSWELLVSVLRFRSTERARIAELVAAAPHPPVVVRLGSRAEVRRWLQGVDGRPAS